MKRRNSSQANAKYVLASGVMLALVGLLTDIRGLVTPAPNLNKCKAIVQSQAVLSRDQLTRLLNVPQRSGKEQVRAIVSEPYCVLPSVEIRTGVAAEREAYPLAFDPDTWFVVLYEGGEYAGYDFSFRR